VFIAMVAPRARANKAVGLSQARGVDLPKMLRHQEENDGVVEVEAVGDSSEIDPDA
jgi:hypothetical protein